MNQVADIFHIIKFLEEISGGFSYSFLKEREIGIIMLRQYRINLTIESHRHINDFRPEVLTTLCYLIHCLFSEDIVIFPYRFGETVYM